MIIEAIAQALRSHRHHHFGSPYQQCICGWLAVQDGSLYSHQFSTHLAEVAVVALKTAEVQLIPESALWDLVDKWRGEADTARTREMPYLNTDPRIAYAQGMNGAAEELSDLVLDIDERQDANQ